MKEKKELTFEDIQLARNYEDFERLKKWYRGLLLIYLYGPLSVRDFLGVYHKPRLISQFKKKYEEKLDKTPQDEKEKMWAKFLRWKQEGRGSRFKIARQLEEVALKDDYFVKRKLYPDVDLY